MAYYGYPTYQQYYNPYQPQAANLGQFQPQNQPSAQPNGIVTVRSEDEARNYPVAPGNSVTFRNESEPYIYTKTMGMSQLDRPVFDKYRLVKEAEKTPETAPAVDMGAYALKTDVEALRVDFDDLKAILSKKGKVKADE